jgi:SAM-dependent methyltransferase
MAGIKAQAQERFGRYAERYVSSPTHAAGYDLDRLLELAQPHAAMLALDVATGGGHTARQFAPWVRQVIAFDLTPDMLKAARTFISGQGLTNVPYAAGDAEALPFAAGVFDLVSCRIAAHHFPDPFRFVQETARTLKPGGLFVLQDQAAPEDEAAARYLNSFERLRDPSHVRMYAEYEWRGMCLDAGLTVEAVEIWSRSSGGLVTWAERQGSPPEVIEQLQVMLAQMPQSAADWYKPRCAGTPDATFDHVYILLAARKSG